MTDRTALCSRYKQIWHITHRTFLCHSPIPHAGCVHASGAGVTSESPDDWLIPAPCVVSVGWTSVVLQRWKTGGKQAVVGSGCLEGCGIQGSASSSFLGSVGQGNTSPSCFCQQVGRHHSWHGYVCRKTLHVPILQHVLMESYWLLLGV